MQIEKLLVVEAKAKGKQLHRPGAEDASAEESDDVGAPFHHSFSHSPNIVFFVACFHVSSILFCSS